MKEENLLDPVHSFKEEQTAVAEPPEAEPLDINKDFLVLHTLLIGNSIRYYFLFFVPVFAVFSILSLKGLQISYQYYPDLHFFIPFLIWLLVFLQVGMNLARFINDFFVVKKLGKIELSEGLLKVDGKTIDILQTKKITFHYKGDEYWKFPSGLWVLFALSKRHSSWLYTNPKELYDYIEIDGVVHYVRLKNAKDRDTFFHFSQWINKQKPRLSFLIKER